MAQLTQLALCRLLHTWVGPQRMASHGCLASQASGSVPCARAVSCSLRPPSDRLVWLMLQLSP